MIDRPAGFFEGTEMPTAGWWEALWPAPRNVLIAVGISSEMEVVDLCSGDGWFTLEIAKLAHRVIAIDIDPKLLEVAQIRLIENRSRSLRRSERSSLDEIQAITEDVQRIVADLDVGGASAVITEPAKPDVKKSISANPKERPRTRIR